ncbi:MAG: putative amidoligase domain-containing protein [Thermocrinis sp.]|jgi:hypothetical protein|uniref:putative amidoligase domain-containing protein n=1 Tax=Thermocrinis sp. TaxID=2024383 RepID=UPI003C046F7E
MKKLSIKGVPYKGVIVKALHYVEGDVYDYKEFPHHAVLVVKRGTRLHEIAGVGVNLDLGWAELFPAFPPDDWQGDYASYLAAYDVPVYAGLSSVVRGVWFQTYATRRWLFVIPEEEWERNWEEVKEYLFSYGIIRPRDLGNICITLGGDPEFEVYVDGKLVPARKLSIFKRGGRFGPIGTDGDTGIAELRPKPAYSEEEYVGNFLNLVKSLRRKTRREYALSVKGDVYPLGGHIHVGSPNKKVVKVLQGEVRTFIEALDDFLGRVLLPTSGPARRGTGNARPGVYELKYYGWEYKTVPSSIYADLEVVRIVYKLVKNLVETLLKEEEISYEVVDGRAERKEYLRFLTEEETKHFLSFPQRWAQGEILPFVPMEEAAVVP